MCRPPTAVGAMRLYRANMRPRLLRPRLAHTTVPVQVVVPTGDRYVSPALTTGAGAVDRPPVAARDPRPALGGDARSPTSWPGSIGELVDHIEGGPESPGLRRSRVSGHGRARDGWLVVVTGAGSGIGRATCLAFAEQGAVVVAADIDGVTAARTAELARLVGAPDARAFTVDVGDADAMERFAKEVDAELGVPDVVVNNAGIGIAGGVLATSVDDWERILRVNLWGVIHGSRLFAAQMAARGEGGHIVNVASAAAFVPSRTLPAYATTKAAVLMLSECLRAEVGGLGIGVSAICPGLIDTGHHHRHPPRRRERRGTGPPAAGDRWPVPPPGVPARAGGGGRARRRRPQPGGRARRARGEGAASCSGGWRRGSPAASPGMELTR